MERMGKARTESFIVEKFVTWVGGKLNAEPKIGAKSGQLDGTRLLSEAGSTVQVHACAVAAANL